VRRLLESRLLLAGFVALHAALRILLRIGMKREDQLGRGHCRGIVALRAFFGVGVGLARTVAHLATRHRVRLGRGDRRVLGLAELPKFRPVAGAAPLGPHVATPGRRRDSLSGDRGGFCGGRPRLRQPPNPQ